MVDLVVVLVDQFLHTEDVSVPVRALLDSEDIWFLDLEPLSQSFVVAVWWMTTWCQSWWWLLRALCDLN